MLVLTQDHTYNTKALAGNPTRALVFQVQEAGVEPARI